MITCVCPFKVCNVSKFVAISGPMGAPVLGLALGAAPRVIIEGGAFAWLGAIVTTAPAWYV